MSIEEYFNPSTEQNTRGMCAYSVGGISQCTAVIGINDIEIIIQKQQNVGLEIANDTVASATNIFSLAT